jgi:DNA-binding transcriptional LysR family regulator
MAINELRSISIFVSAAELGSLRKAAAAMGISPQAASQALVQLEKHVDARLFHRTTRVMSLTDEGRQFLEEARPALQGLQRTLENVKRSKEEISGPLRIVGPRSTFQRIIWQLLDEFCQQYPKIVPDVLLEDRVGNWVEDRVDVGFRMGLSPHEGVIARHLFPIQMIICASPAYLQKYGTPITLADLQSHRCSVFRSPYSGAIIPWHVKMGDQVIEQSMVPAICSNDEILELQAVLAGRVVAQLAGVTAAPYIRSGQLVPLLVDHVSESASYFVYFGSRTSQTARARAFIDLAVSRLAGNTEYVLSERELRSAQTKRHHH